MCRHREVRLELEQGCAADRGGVSLGLHRSPSESNDLSQPLDSFLPSVSYLTGRSKKNRSLTLEFGRQRPVSLRIQLAYAFDGSLAVKLSFGRAGNFSAREFRNIAHI